MKTAGVIIDKWKLPIFKKHLDASSFKYGTEVGPTAGIVTLQVKCEWANELRPIIEAAEKECKTFKKGKK